MFNEMTPMAMSKGDTSVLHGQVTTTAKTETVERNIIGVLAFESSGYAFVAAPSVVSDKYIYFNSTTQNRESFTTSGARISYLSGNTVTITPYSTSYTLDYYIIY